MGHSNADTLLYCLPYQSKVACHWWQTHHHQSRAEKGSKKKPNYSHFNQSYSNSSLIVNAFVLPSGSFGRRDLGSSQYNLLYAPQIASLQLAMMATIRPRCIEGWEGIKFGGASFFGNHVAEDSASALTVECPRWRKASGLSDCWNRCDSNGEKTVGPARISTAGRAQKLWKVADR
jgi:hypothetical protein